MILQTVIRQVMHKSVTDYKCCILNISHLHFLIILGIFLKIAIKTISTDGPL